MKALCTVLFLLVAVATIDAGPPQAPRPPQAPPLATVVSTNCGCGPPDCECGSICTCGPNGHCSSDCPCGDSKKTVKRTRRAPYARDVCEEQGCQCGCLEGGRCTCGSKAQVAPARQPVQYSQPAPVFYQVAEPAWQPACQDCQPQQPAYQQPAYQHYAIPQQTYQPQSWSYPRQYSGGFGTTFSRGFTGGFARGGGGGRSC